MTGTISRTHKEDEEHGEHDHLGGSSSVVNVVL